MDIPTASQNIKALEGALAQLPLGPVFEVARGSITQQLAELKQSITKSKPMGAQLDSCRSAIERAQRRKASAVEAMDKARVEQMQAESDILRLNSELSALETQVEQQAGARQPGQQASSVQCMATALNVALADMKSSAHIPRSTIAEAEDHMAALLTGIQTIAAEMQQRQQRAAQPVIVVPDLPAPLQLEVSGQPAPKAGGPGAPRRLRQKTGPTDTNWEEETVFPMADIGLLLH